MTGDIFIFLIGKELGRAMSTVSRELKRLGPGASYGAACAQASAGILGIEVEGNSADLRTVAYLSSLQCVTLPKRTILGPDLHLFSSRNLGVLICLSKRLG